ncbi:hypothetical protein C2U70_27180 [Bradyrhizobium guangdongense]|uniref:ABC transporter substrate-binding protein n=1 Tax=Bradyrhizobium guangdongense TaxID=1325090 RepID=UPI00112DE8D1|nr:ABC transporter substrate-binding protein [Bradyrhizobium guangdongense]TPQ30227.1 hypothetical protein C2U70_27180 [Bradyrhizobium guangdongense]
MAPVSRARAVKGRRLRLKIVFIGIAFGVVIAGLALTQTRAPTVPARANSYSASAYVTGRPGDYLGLLVAKNTGLFRNSGLQVSIEVGPSDAAAISAVIDGSRTIGVANATSFLLARQTGARIVAFAAGYVESPIVFLVREKSGIRTPRDFVNRKIGYFPGQNSSTIYEALLARTGVPRSRINEIAGASEEDFLTGKVDVWPASVGDVYRFREKAQVAIIAPIDFGIHVPGTVYFATEETVVHNPELLGRFIRSLIDGWNLTYEKLEKGDTIPDEPLLSSNQLRAELDQQLSYLRPLASRFAEFSPAQWRSLRDILLSQKLIKDSLDVSKAVTYDVIEEVYRRPIKYAY